MSHQPYTLIELLALQQQLLQSHIPQPYQFAPQPYYPQQYMQMAEYYYRVQQLKQQHQQQLQQQQLFQSMQPVKIENVKTEIEIRPIPEVKVEALVQQAPRLQEFKAPLEKVQVTQKQETPIPDPASVPSDSSYRASDVEEIQSASPKVKKVVVKVVKKTKKISKNIPKNIFKGIVKYVLGRKDDIRTHFEGHTEKVAGFIHYVKRHKNSVLSMQQLKKFLHSKKNEEYAKLMRIFSYQFITRDFVAYIYNSKIKCRREHIGNRHKFINLMLSSPL